MVIICDMRRILKLLDNKIFTNIFHLCTETRNVKTVREIEFPSLFHFIRKFYLAKCGNGFSATFHFTLL